jgi:hypothetical protein
MVSPVASLAPGVIGFLGITYVLNVFPPDIAAICVISEVRAVTEYYTCIIIYYWLNNKYASESVVQNYK